jgi:hypothetical protein
MRPLQVERMNAMFQGYVGGGQAYDEMFGSETSRMSVDVTLTRLA